MDNTQEPALPREKDSHMGRIGKGKLPLASAENRGRGYHIPGDTGQSQRKTAVLG